jgi:hypothetical protein
LTGDENELVKKYKADKEVLLKRDVKIPFTERVYKIDITIGSLLGGQTFKCDDISEILASEQSVKESCEAFKNYLEAMRNFGGKEVFEFN